MLCAIYHYPVQITPEHVVTYNSKIYQVKIIKQQ